MQIISLGVLAAGAANPPDFPVVLHRLAEFLHRDDVRWLAYLGIAIFIGTQLLNALWCWIAARVVVRGEHATFGNACKVCLAWLVLPIAIGAGIIFLGPMMLESLTGLSPLTAWALFGCFLFLCVLITFMIPMRIYEIGFLEALGFILLSSVISVIGTSAVQFGVGKVLGVEARIAALTAKFGTTEAERDAFVGRLFGKDAPDEIDRLLDNATMPIGNPKSQVEREAAIQTIQQKLETRRRTLPLGDPKALAAFQLQFDRYLRLLDQAKADRAAQIATPTKT